MEVNKLKATRESYGEMLEILGKKNKNIVVLDADLAISTKTEKFKKLYPKRFLSNCLEGRYGEMDTALFGCRRGERCGYNLWYARERQAWRTCGRVAC